MDSKQKFTEAIESITISHYADIYLNEDFPELRWDIVDAISCVEPDEEAPLTKTVAFALDYDEYGERYYFAATLIFDTPLDVVVYDVFEIDVNLFLDFVSSGDWIDCSVN